MIFPWDQLNVIQTKIQALTIEYEYRGTRRKHIPARTCEDIILEFLIDSYLMGNSYVTDSMGKSPVGVDEDEMYGSVYRKVAGKNFIERVSEYCKTGEVEDIMRVAETDSHRVFNESELRTAKKVGAKEKIWNCMFVNSRDTHMYLHGTEVPIDAEFYTFMGNHAEYPGQFGVAEEDCNCHCWLTFK